MFTSLVPGLMASSGEISMTQPVHWSMPFITAQRLTVGRDKEGGRECLLFLDWQIWLHDDIRPTTTLARG